jgi:argininosuccinate lyase
MTPRSSHKADSESSPGPHRLWGGRFTSATAQALHALNRSIATDLRLWPFDIRGSKAWAVGLWNAGVITLEESRALEAGLDAVAGRLDAGEQPDAGDEDVHTMIDRLLHEEAGDVASKLHTGRSRNDQVATATRLWVMDGCTRLDAHVRTLELAILEQAKTVDEVLMPAYTHLQRAQPVSAAHWLLSHFWPLERDRARLALASRSASVLPLGSGAVAGCAFPVSRVLLQGSLGFSSLTPNSIDAVSDRDFVAETLFALTLLATHLSRFAEDLIIYGSSEFGFVRFGESFTTGSSMMPQKRNPDALELTRGSAARTLGDFTALLTALKGLPSGYNKDLQDDKRALFDASDTMSLVLPALAGAVAELEFDTARMRQAISGSMMATDLADYLVLKGKTFREAHHVVGSLVRLAEKRSVGLDQLSMEDLQNAAPAFEADAAVWLSPEHSVSRREASGGTGPSAVRAQIEAAERALQPPSERRRMNEVELQTT